MTGHWIIAPVVLPAVLAAAVLLLRGRAGAARVVSTAGLVALLGIAVGLMVTASSSGPQLYRLGDWPAPFGIVLILDRLSALMLLLTAGLGLLVLVQAMVSGWDRRGAAFHALFLFQMMGLNGAFLTGDAFNLFVFFEVLLIASYGLMVHGGGGLRIRAGIHYVAVNLIGSTLFLFALAVIYAVTGTLNMADIALRAANLPEGDVALLRVGAVLLMLVFAIKGALVPLHFWLPGTYANAPGVVAALFAIMTKVGAYAAIRMGMLAFPPGHPVTGTLLSDLMLPAALVTVAVGAVGVLGARTLPRLAAFAAVASMGTAFVAIAGFDPAHTGAALYYIVHSTLAGALLFLIADMAGARGALSLSTTAATPRLPGALAVLFLVAGIAAAGLPPLSGFIGKLLVLQATGAQAALVWSVILGASFLMVVGFARAGSALFWKADGPPAPPVQAGELVVPGMLLAGLVALTAAAGPVTGWLEATAESLANPVLYINATQLGVGGAAAP